MKYISDSIEGWFSEDDKKFYYTMFKRLPTNSKIVEIGAFKGRSSSYMAHLIANSTKTIKFYCVDTWEGSPEHQKGGTCEDKDVLNNSLFSVFENNMLPFAGFYTPVKRTSLQSASLFNDNDLDFVFIDASHDYKSVMSDIKAWLPKVKQGGVIGGHDYFHPPINLAVTQVFSKTDFVIGSCWGKII
jgi:hypothetical protein